jgi:hypothetical protein
VNQSIKFGTTIPANMKPWIQQLIDSGKLLGDDHKAITDINQLHFGGDMQTTLDHLNDTLQKLIDALNVGLPNATRKAGKTWRDELGDLPAPGSGGAGSSGGGSGSGQDDGSGPGPGQRPGSAVLAVPVQVQVSGRTILEALVTARQAEGV